LKHEHLTERLIGAYYTLYNDLGHGFLESIYRKAFGLILRDLGLEFKEEFPIEVFYRGISLGEFRMDLLVESCVILELKAMKNIEQAHERQLTNYLRSTNLEVGLLFNFGPRPQFRRLIFDNDRKQQPLASAAAIP
jgi:GxxExxY protein